MKLLTKLTLLVVILSACTPLASQTPEAALTPGTYKYQDFAYYMTWSSDDSMIALTTLTGLYVYDTNTKKQLAAFDKLSGSIVAFGKEHLAAINGDGLFVWNLKEFKPLFHYKAEEPTTFQSIAISPDDTILITGEQKQLRIWSLPDGKLMASIPHESPMSDLAFKNNTRLISADSYLGVIQEWDIQTRKKMRDINVGTPVVRFNLSNDGQVVIVDYGNSGFELWDVNKGKLKHVYRDIISAPGWSNLSGDNQSVVVWGYNLNTNDSGLSVWDLPVHTQLFEFTTPLVNGDGWRNGALNSDSSILAASNNEGYIYFYDMKSGEKTGEIFLPYEFIVEKG